MGGSNEKQIFLFRVSPSCSGQELLVERSLPGELIDRAVASCRAMVYGVDGERKVERK